MKYCLCCFKEISEDLEICPYCGYIEGTPAQEGIHMDPGTVLADRYLIGRVIGYGGFGVTYVAWDRKLEQKVAVKEYLPSEFSTRMPGQTRISVFGGEKSEQFRDGMNKFLDEARRLAKFQNEDGIVKVYDCISENETAYIVMEYLEGQTLKELLEKEKTIPEEEAIKILMPVMESLKTVHQDGIIHRDIAPDNIFITKDGTAKLIDFGASRFATTSHSRSLTVLVKPGYSPEEQYRSRGDQGPHTDVYSLAATLYKMVTGKTPPDALERRAKIESTKKDLIEEPRKINKDVSLRFENAVMNALNVRIEDRTKDISQFIQELTSEVPVKRRYGKIKRIDFYRWPLWLKIAAPGALILLLAFGLLLAVGVIRFKDAFSSEVVLQEGYGRVPNVLNMDRKEAAAILEEAGFNYVYGESVVSEYLEKNIVISQDPGSGGIYQKNSIVSLVICEGDGSDPSLVFKLQEEVTGILDENGITYDIQTEYSNVAADLICRVVLDDGTEIEYLSEIPEGAHVTIYVSMGLQPVTVPDFYNMTLEEATAKLYEVGLVPDEANYVYEVTDAVEPGHIFSQSIASGQEVTIGTAISFSIAVEETTELIEVPDVKGMDQDTAKTTLENAGFKVTVYQESSTSVPVGYVTKQNPSAGSMREAEASVTIYVSTGAPDTGSNSGVLATNAVIETEATTSPTTPTTESTEETSTVNQSSSANSTPTPTPTSTPSPTPIPLTISNISDVEIHREEGIYSATVQAVYTPSNATVEWKSSDT